MSRRWLALLLTFALAALPFAASAAEPAATGTVWAAACACDGPPACAERECPPAADCGTCTRVPVFAAGTTAAATGARTATRAPAARPAWHGRIIAPAPEPPRA